MPRWLISVPVWGERCLDVFCATALPALEKAMVALGGEAILVVHTDAPRRISDGATEIRVESRPVPAGARDFDSLSQAHREVLGMACVGDRVALLTADIVVSEGSLSRCEHIFQEDASKHIIMCCCIRALQEGRIPDTTSGEYLLRWAWEHRHPMVVESTWPGGHSADLSRLYFEQEGAVVARQALPHPLAVRKSGYHRMSFGPTIDASLVQNFSIAEIHVEVSSDALALVELSPRDKHFDLHALTILERQELGEFRLGDPIQFWLANHRIGLFGDPHDVTDDWGVVLPAEEIDRCVR